MKFYRGICDGCGKFSLALVEVNCAPVVGASICPKCRGVAEKFPPKTPLEHYNASHPPTIAPEIRDVLIDEFVQHATAGECLFQFYWSRRHHFLRQGELALE